MSTRIARFIHRFPRHWVWFAVYCFVNAAIFLGITLAAVISVIAGDPLRFGTEVVALGPPQLVALSLPIGLAFLLGPLLPRKDYVWRYNVALLCFGASMLYLLPFAVAVMAYWFDDDIKSMYGVHDERPTVRARGTRSARLAT